MRQLVGSVQRSVKGGPVAVLVALGLAQRLDVFNLVQDEVEVTPVHHEVIVDVGVRVRCGRRVGQRGEAALGRHDLPPWPWCEAASEVGPSKQHVH